MNYADSEFDRFARFFSETCVAYLKSMREYNEPSIGRQATIDSLRENLKV
jgi:hypothetical protein